MTMHKSGDPLAPYKEAMRARYPEPGAIYAASRRRRKVTRVVSGVALAAVATLTLLLDPAYRTQHFRTAVGDTGRWTLADGSGLALDTASELQVEWRLRSRRLTLVRGQALFDVAPSRLRRFEVWAGDSLIEDIGTVFSVRSEAGGLRVQVLEGAVRIHGHGAGPLASGQDAWLPAPGGSTPSATGPGEVTSLPSILVAEGQGVDIPEPGEVRQAILARDAFSWSEGRLVFDAVPLSQAVAELQRYRPGLIRLADAEVARMRVSAQVEVSSLDTLIGSLPHILPVQVSHQDDGSIDISARQ